MCVPLFLTLAFLHEVELFLRVKRNKSPEAPQEIHKLVSCINRSYFVNSISYTDYIIRESSREAMFLYKPKDPIHLALTRPKKMPKMPCGFKAEETKD